MAKNNILGVDVGSGSVKAMAGAIDESGKVAILGSGNVSISAMNRGVLADAKTIAPAIRDAVECALMAADIPLAKIYIGIGGTDIVSANNIGSIAISGSITEKDIENACRAAVVTVIGDDQFILHVIPGSYWIDGMKSCQPPIGKKGAKLEVEAHIVTVADSLMNGLAGELTAQGLQVAGFMANAITGAEAVVAGQPRGNCLVLDIGAGVSDLVLYRQGVICNSASVPLGGDYITRDIMQGFEISMIQAEEIKRRYAGLNKRLFGQKVMLDSNESGLPNKQMSYDFLYKIIESRIQEIVTLLYEYLEPVLRENPPERILLTGGSSALPSFAEDIAKIFGIPVSLTKPQGLPAEYAKPSNVACFGTLNYAASLNPAAKTKSGGGWQSVLKKIKRFI